LIVTALLALAAVVHPHVANAARLKDLAALEGVRDNQLIGYGLVVGLAGTGDKRQTIFAAQSLTNMLERMGVSVPPAAIQVRNTAAVMVTATLPPFAQPGTRLDVTVAAIGDATNLQGGQLLLTSLRGPDGRNYAAAQGAVVTGGFIAGRGANNQSTNHPTAGRVVAGGIVEQAPPTPAPGTTLRLQLRQGDFTTAQRVADAINRRFAPEGPPLAHAANSALVVAGIPARFEGTPVAFLAELEALRVDTEPPARIVINERTGTIALGKDVRIMPAAILHGSLSVQIQTTYNVSQPTEFSRGQTVVTPQVDVAVKEDKARNIVLKEGASVEELVRALTAIGSTARDIIAILQSLKAAGALEGDIEVI
jgi:flagellar P-ring protein FlgI